MGGIRRRAKARRQPLERRYPRRRYVESPLCGLEDLLRTLKSTSINRIIRSPAGYKEYHTNRTYMAKMGDWRDDSGEEIELDGIGGVNILVKAEVHRSGKSLHQSIVTPVCPLKRHDPRPVPVPAPQSSPGTAANAIR